MADTILLQLGEDQLLLLIAKVVNTCATISRDEVELRIIYFNDFRNEAAALLIEKLEHAQLIFVALAGLWSPESLVHKTIITDANDRTGCIFGFFHKFNKIAGFLLCKGKI